MSNGPGRRWESFAASEPFFAILSHEKYLRANLDESAERAFFESGEEHVAMLFETIRTHVSSTFAAASALEYGCGAGRLAIPLARRVGSVTAVDASPAMLAAAREQAAKAGVTKIDFASAKDFASDRRHFDLVTLHLVLQRLPPSEGLPLLRTVAEKVGYGGIGVFHVPFRKTSKRSLEAVRWTRAHVPGANAAFNIARGKTSIPYFPTYTYELNDVFALLQDAGFEKPYVVMQRHGDVDGAIVHAQRERKFVAVDAPVENAPAPLPASDFIDVRDMIAKTSIEDLNRTAEAYFSSLTEWEHHIAKPLSKVDETPPLLINFGTLLQGLELMPGQTVVDYGAGSGWLSRFLTQLGARMILLDVSPSALNIARELYAKLPVVGDRPEPRFLVYDGRKIDLPDESVDRIVCFDAFHHAPNPGDVLREFGRILKPGGIAGFAEPGPHHSKTAQSQFEMRTYGVVENDVDVRALWNEAQKYGFVDLKLAAWHLPPFHVRLDEYEDLLAGGETYARFAELNRNHLRNVRDFFMRKAGLETIDSRRIDALRSTIEAELIGTPRANEPIIVRATVTNAGAAIWLPPDEYGGVALGCHLYDGAGRLLKFDHHWARLTEPPRPIAPGETLTIDIALPPLPAGSYELELDCVAQKIAWFTQVGSRTARVKIGV
jgi:ubiquinone/menaquinone biosynthesis C-methylase UbiE